MWECKRSLHFKSLARNDSDMAPSDVIVFSCENMSYGNE